MGMMNIIKRFGRKSFAHGIHPPQQKDLTSLEVIKRIPFPHRVSVPLLQHFGVPARPLVHKGQEVVRGEPIAEADGFMSVPMHAPVTGTVEGVELIPTARGPKTMAIIIKTHLAASQQVLYGTPREWRELDAEQLNHAVQNTGMVGLGGAGFPSHVKLDIPDGHLIDKFVVNGCECEPYLTTDHRLMLERTDELLEGIRIGLKISGAEEAIVGIEDNKLDAVAAIRAKIRDDDRIRVEVVKTKYPQGSEKLLITALLDREVPSGGYPYQIGVVVNNIATLTQLGQLIPQQQGLIERVVTITGPGVGKPGNYLVPVGTPLRHILEYVGYFGEANRLILGGPMMGNSVASVDVPLTKPVSGILVLDEKAANRATDKIYPCIQCAKCVSACPVSLNPSQLGRLAAKKDYSSMQDSYSLSDCFECGSCSYVCPSNIPLVQYFRISKAVLRERSAA